MTQSKNSKFKSIFLNDIIYESSQHNINCDIIKVKLQEHDGATKDQWIAFDDIMMYVMYVMFIVRKEAARTGHFTEACFWSKRHHYFRL